MKINLTSSLFMAIMMVGVMITLSSNSMLMMWVGLELSMISFIPMMTMEENSGSESSMKYFIIQSISSCMLILGMLCILMNFMSEYIMILSLCIKIGLAPFHGWVLSMVDGLSYFLLFILLSIMKISPIFIISFYNFNFSLFIIISLMIGSFSGLNQNSIRKLISYSSIYNLGFMFSTLHLNSVWSMYLFIYSIILMMIVMLLMNFNLNYLNQFLLNNFNFKEKMVLWTCLLSLGGMPPMLGFLNKIIIFENLMLNNNYLLLMMMILTSLLVMFYYIRISLISMMTFTLMMKWNFFLKKNYSYLMLLINLMMFPLFVLVKTVS
uniref:NADH-ubiquinone oxidoreductase chain 2 n=1 Tax=Sophonia nigrilineata TaxID=3092776 RepID=A0AAF0Z1Q6_9HEMI|nr:NADH dehydrogenase subunit 2 [Sophonia nigrilineata]WPC85221.1 NADH dehydrogenase subunit 2 [Sophonia nigrilineata]